MKYYLREMRVHHYIKNLLIFGPLLFSGQLFNTDKAVNAIFGFAALCAMSSLIYIMNDLADIEKDRAHPTKCRRPIAAGQISVASARVLMAAMGITALIFNGLAFDIRSTALLLLYFLLNLGYSMGLKKIPIIDVAILISGFLIRLLYGALITDIAISNWLYLTVISFALYMALGKRRNEFRNTNPVQTRTVLKYYTKDFLDKTMYMSLTLFNVFYALWSMDERTVSSYNEHLIWTVPIVILICLKYSLNVELESDGDPIEVLLNDKLLMVMCAVYILIMFLILYI